MTLTELSYYSRRFLPFLVLFFLILLIFYYSVKLFFVYLSSTQPKKIYTNPIFGKIKKPYLPEASSSAGFNFTLDTIEGRPITASESAKVYFLPPSVARFGYREKIYLMAKAFGFDTAAVKYQLVEKMATFADGRQKLTVDITNFNFRYDYYFENESELFSNAFIPSKKEIENKAIDFLTSAGRYPDELAKGKININLLRYNPQENNFAVVFQPNEANVVEVNFYRPDIDNTTIVTPGFPSSQNYVILTFFESGFKVLRAQVKFFEKSDEQVGIYPLISGELAWDKLKKGKGVVITVPTFKKDIVIKNMFLAYFDPDIYQEYLQPVYVFLGEPNFVAYVPAVADEYFLE